MSSILISAENVISLAYITNIDASLIKEEIIATAQLTYIKPVLGTDLYDYLILHPEEFTTLINDFILPCLAFYSKYLIYSQQVFETAAYSNPESGKANELINPDAAALIDTKMHSMIIKDILFIARQKEQALIDHLKYHPQELYVAPTKKRISGFLLPS